MVNDVNLLQKYDFLIVGAGLFGSVFAKEASRRGKRVLVIERREHIGGNVYTERLEGITVHKYGAHIFHTSRSDIWEYVNRYARFIPFVNSPIAKSGGVIYNLPFNMNTFSKMWNIEAPREAEEIISRQIKAEGVEKPTNLEEQALSLVGRDVYEKLIKGYTEKQWDKSCSELPPSIIKRIPLRFTYDNNYFNDIYQGIPEGGYTALINELLRGIPVLTSSEYREFISTHPEIATKTVYTGRIDELYDFKYGPLDYRSLRFETEVLETENYQGAAVVNFTDNTVPYTRIIEHKHFEKNKTKKTVITREYSVSMKEGSEPYYPINDEKNNQLYEKYRTLAKKNENLILGGRLAEYKYYDMDKVIASAIEAARRELSYS